MLAVSLRFRKKTAESDHGTGKSVRQFTGKGAEREQEAGGGRFTELIRAHEQVRSSLYFMRQERSVPRWCGKTEAGAVVYHAGRNRRQGPGTALL